MAIDAPVLLIAFKRPETTQIVFNRLREVKTKKLFVAIDGPRSSSKDEYLLCEQVLGISKQIDWECDAQYRIRETNMGCRDAVVDAISWVFTQEDRVIIVEDDVVPEMAFFEFAQELLEYYKDDSRIGMISGNNYTQIIENDGDYLFSRYAHIWGWATWKRVWNDFDVSCPEIERTLLKNNFNKMIKGRSERRFFKKYFSFWLAKQKLKQANAWGPFFFFHILYKGYLSVVPALNLSTNIGIVGEHTFERVDQHFWPTAQDFKIRSHPKRVKQNEKYDKYHFKKHINREKPPAFIKRVINRLLRILTL
jgi:hypothetical protein